MLIVKPLSVSSDDISHSPIVSILEISFDKVTGLLPVVDLGVGLGRSVFGRWYRQFFECSPVIKNLSLFAFPAHLLGITVLLCEIQGKRHMK